MIRVPLSMALLSMTALYAQAVPSAVLGQWRINHVITAMGTACWDNDRAQTLAGTFLVYGPGTLRWQGGEVSLQGIRAVTRTLTRKSFLQEYGLALESLGVHTDVVTEVNLQHEDADVTGGSTEVPGDTVLLAGPRRIVISACGVFYDAVRVRR